MPSPQQLVQLELRSPDPAAILRDSRKQAVQLATQTGVVRMRTVLKTAQADLTRRLNHAQGLKGPGLESFTAAQLQTTLTHVREVLGSLKPGMQSSLLTTGGEVAQRSAQDSIAYMQSAESRFTGITQPLALHEATVLDRAARGAESSLLHRLQGSPQHGPGILQRYGAGVVENFEGVLQQRFIAQVPWGETRDRLTAASPFLQGAPAHWAERIVRTEVMGAANRSTFEAMQEIGDQLGDGNSMLKILCATFDERTSSDSWAVHGQIRRVSEPFDTWQGPVMTPPARPNDREVVVPHRMSWPIPGNLKPMSAAQVASRWASEGRKGAHPPIPRYSTVDVDQIGKVAAPVSPPDAPPGVRGGVSGGLPEPLEQPHPSTLHAPLSMPRGIPEESPAMAQARVATEVRQDAALGLTPRHTTPHGLRSLIWNHAEDKDEFAFARMRTDEVAKVLGVSVPHALRQLQAAAREGFVNREGRQRANEEGTFQGRVEGRGGYQLWGVPPPHVPPKAPEPPKPKRVKTPASAEPVEPALSPEELKATIQSHGFRLKGNPDEVAKFFGRPLTKSEIEGILPLALKKFGEIDGAVWTGEGKSFSFSASVHAGGDVQATCDRTFKRTREGLVVEHELFKIDERHQNDGTGKVVIKNQVEQYLKLGVSRIDVSSAWVGRYVWPKWGFTHANPSDLEKSKSRAAYIMKNRGIDQIDADAVLSGVRSIHGLATARLGDRQIGKEILLDRDYYSDRMTMKVQHGNQGFETLKKELGLPAGVPQTAGQRQRP